MTCVPNKGNNFFTKPPVDNVKANNKLNTPCMKYRTDQTVKSAFQTTTMKQPTRMRNGDFGGNTDSSAFEIESTSSDYIGSSYRPDGNTGSYLVSARYNRRRSSSNTVHFNIPEGEIIERKDLNSPKLFKNEKPDSYKDSDEENTEDCHTGYNWSNRRMSAPELPPISINGRQSSLINNGSLTSRSNTFHNYRFNAESRGTRKSIHSDSSLQGYIINTQSRTSSSSSQKSRGRVLSAGADRRTTSNKHITLAPELVIEKPPTSKVKPATMKNGMATIISAAGQLQQNGRCGSVAPVYKRTKSKLNISSPRKMYNSETQFNSSAMEQSNKRQYDKGLKRNSSDKSLTDLKKNSINKQNNSINDRKNSSKHKSTANGNLSNLNGMRKYSSTLGLTTKDDSKEENDLPDKTDPFYDSDSDSDKDQRVINWIIGVNEVAEPPEEPNIEYVDEPPQRDTAIRIVYDGDS